MRKAWKEGLFIILAIAVLLASGCTKAKPAGLTEDEVSAVTANLLSGLDSGNLEAFKKDMSSTMKDYYNQEQLNNLQQLLQEASGRYISLQKPALTNNQDYALYRFPAVYEKETVYVTVSFKVDGKEVEGLWFDSPNLRGLPPK